MFRHGARSPELLEGVFRTVRRRFSHWPARCGTTRSVLALSSQFSCRLGYASIASLSTTIRRVKLGTGPDFTLCEGACEIGDRSRFHMPILRVGDPCVRLFACGFSPSHRLRTARACVRPPFLLAYRVSRFFACHGRGFGYHAAKGPQGASDGREQWGGWQERLQARTSITL